MYLIGTVIGIGGIALGFVMLVFSFAMLVAYPLLALVAVPLWFLLIWWVRRRFFRRRTPFTAYHLLTGQEEPQEHVTSLMEPFTIGGHMRDHR